ncbi:MAG: hypothetical protein WAX33_04070 [Rectinemataceae bacterium]
MAAYESLDRLIETERRAAAVVEDAKALAAKRIAEAAENAETEKKLSLMAESLRLEAEFAASRKKIDEEAGAELETYRRELDASIRNARAFRIECERYLEGPV